MLFLTILYIVAFLATATISITLCFECLAMVRGHYFNKIYSLQNELEYIDPASVEAGQVARELDKTTRIYNLLSK